MRLIVPAADGLRYVTQVADELRAPAELLLRRLANVRTRDGESVRVRADWGIVKLDRRGADVLVEEPDYRSDPTKYVPGVNFTCAVLRAQQRVHDRLGESAEPVNYDQFVLVYPGAANAERIVAIRQPSTADGDSGWRLFAADRIAWSDEPQAHRVYELAATRPTVLSVLSLPTGWSIKFKNSVLEEAAAPAQDPRVMGFNVDPFYQLAS